MTNIFEIAARRKLRFPSSKGLLTAEQLFDLPLTSAAGRANLNEIAVAIDDERETIGRKSFVDTSSNPRRGDLDAALEIVVYVIGVKQAEAAEQRNRTAKAAQRAKLLDAIDAAESRELGSKTRAQLEAELAALD